MAPPALPAGGFGVAAIPIGMAGVAGMYIIINCSGAAENRYVGISSNIGTRFGTRMAVVTEMGIDAATLANIHVVWGQVKVRNHPAPGAPAPVPPWLACARVPAGGPGTGIPFPAWGDPGWILAVPPAVGAFLRNIDGTNVNLEHLLIRFVMNRLGAGGTVSNNLLMAPFTNIGIVGAQPLIVKLESAAFGNYNAFSGAATLPVGAAW
jgi:hypothetical protein